MRLPTDPSERAARIEAIRDTLLASLDRRRNLYDTWRTAYLYGQADKARYNRIYPLINTLNAFLYAQESTRFALAEGPESAASTLEWAEPMSQRLKMLWHDSGADAVMASQIRWASVYGAGMVKWVWQDRQLHAYGVHPGDFAVWREDIQDINRQQAVLYRYQLDKSALVDMLRAGGMDDARARQEVAGLSSESGASPPVMGSLVISALNPIGTTPQTGMAGGFGSLSESQDRYRAADAGNTVEMLELWLWDEDEQDYRLIVLAGRTLVVLDRCGVFVKGELPFVVFRPEPLDEYFWGYSQVDALMPLQQWREKRMQQLDRLFQRQLQPPMVFTGFMGGIQDEKVAAVMRRGGVLANSQTPGAKVDMLYPQMPPEAFGEIREIDMMMNETIGLSPTLQGAAEAGVRGGEHASVLVESGSGRILRRALNIEHGLEAAANLMLQILRKYDDCVLGEQDGMKFTAAMFPKDTMVRISSHSSSPLFSNNIQSLALEMLQLGVIDKADFIDLVDPPFADTLKQRVKEREALEQKRIAETLKEIPADEKGSFIAKMFGRKK